MLLQTVSISAVPPCLIWCIATVELKEDVFVFEQEKKIVYNWKKIWRQSFRQGWIQESKSFHQAPTYLCPCSSFSLPFPSHVSLIMRLKHPPFMWKLLAQLQASCPLTERQDQQEGAGPSQHKGVQSVHLCSRTSHLKVIDNHIVHMGRLPY